MRLIRDLFDTDFGHLLAQQGITERLADGAKWLGRHLSQIRRFLLCLMDFTDALQASKRKRASWGCFIVFLFLLRWRRLHRKSLSSLNLGFHKLLREVLIIWVGILRFCSIQHS